MLPSNSANGRGSTAPRSTRSPRSPTSRPARSAGTSPPRTPSHWPWSTKSSTGRSSNWLRQPRGMNHFEALLRSYLAMADSAKVAPAGELSAERVMCIVRIVLSSPALRQAALEYRANAIDAELANRMGAAVDDRGPKLVSAVWGSILMTALTDLADEGREWSQLSIDDVVDRVEVTFAEFTGLTRASDSRCDHLATPPRARVRQWDYLLKSRLRIPCNVEGIPVAEKDEHATLNYPGGELDLDVVHATEGADGIALGSLLAKTGYTTYDEGFVNTASTKSAITYIDGDAGILRYRGYPDRAAGREVELHRGQLSADLRRTADTGSAREVHHPDPAAHPAARGPQAVLRRLPAQRAPDAGAVQCGQRPERVLPGLAGSVRRRAGRAVDHPAAGQAADDRGLCVQEVGRAAVPLPGQLDDASSRTSCG